MNALTKALIAMLVMGGYSSAWFYAGEQHCKGKQEKTAIAQLGKDSTTVDELKASTDRHKVQTQTQVRVIRETIDNCTQQRASLPVLDGLR